MITKEERQIVNKHLHGSPSENSNVEKHVYFITKRTLQDSIKKGLEPGCHFCFNKPLYEIGVPTQRIRPSECKDEFLTFVMSRCCLDKEEAIELYNLLNDKDVRTNSLKADFVKIKNGKPIVVVELNTNIHYQLPSEERYAFFARRLFDDFVKIREIQKIAEYVEIDLRVQDEYGVGSQENTYINCRLNDIISDLA